MNSNPTAAPPNVPALETVLCTEELDLRPSRPPDYEREVHALESLAQSLANSPKTILQSLADTILDLFDCDSVGVSLLTDDEKRFYWPAIAGVWTSHIGAGTPRDFGPCGDVLDRNGPLLFRHPERRYMYLQPALPHAEECLLVPFYVGGKAVGTIWVIAHDENRRFDNEDLRMLTGLGAFASAAYQAGKQFHVLGEQADARQADGQALREMNEALLISSVHQHDLADQARTAEEALRGSEQQRQLALDSAELGSWHVDPTSMALMTDERFRTIFGTANEGLTYDQAFDIIHPDDRDRVSDAVAAATRPDDPVPYQVEYRVLHSDGSVRWVFAKGRANFEQDGAERRLVTFDGTLADITERTQFEKSLHQSEIRYRRLFESAEDGILILDTGTRRITDVNPFILKLLDYPREYFVGKELWEIGAFRDRESCAEAMQELTKGPLRFENMPLQDRSGKHHPVEIVANIYQEDQEPVIQCNIRDISDRKHLEDERESHLNNEQDLRTEAEGANRAKDSFLATLSHEIRTPLSAIIGWTSLLSSGKEVGYDEAELNEGLEVIERNARSMVQLIDDVLDVSRIVSGKLRLEIRPCDLAAVVSAGIDVVRSAAQAKDIALKVDLDSAASGASCDAGRIQQVVWNLVSNAVKFTPRGGTVSVRLAREPSDLRIEVKDSGQGIDSELMPYVFDRFRQADSSTRRRFGGLGLGLSIVKQLVELHGGTVQAHSQGEGHGSTFTVTLPIRALFIDEEGDNLEEPNGFLPLAATVLPLVRLDGLRVLVVDDEFDARRLLVKVLEQAGAVVTAAASVAEAIEAFGSANPEVLVSDLGMPDQDGFDLIREIRRRGHHAKDLPAIALTAFVRKTDRRQALLAGYQVHLSKPVDPHELTEFIASLAGRTGPSV